ncbi:regulator of chromosome condensation-like [Actinia tenebrosa]|uniref:Regulator of chromosome condensation-like n=1 Tax=Actinia tenebrosa TaxID=6105 RepID=A0A6P8HUH7_ACTTE|nr:regulator of chromosome condensation-like [Actinia tenebrosa]
MPTRKRAQAAKRKGPASDGAAGVKKAKKEKDSVIEKETGYVLTMGQGDVGQLGLGEDVLERKKPALVKGLEDVEIVQVECGGMHTVALSNKGEVYSWGCNDEGALGRVTSSEDGSEFTAGIVDLPDDVVIVMVSAGDSHTAALSNKGTVYAWGTYRDAGGQVGLQPDGVKHKPIVILTSDNDPINKVASGNDHTAALTANGNIFTWGCAEQGQLGRVKECFTSRGGRRGLQYILNPSLVRLKKSLKFKDVFCGSYATFAVAKSNTIYAWGLNNYGQLGTGDLENGYLPVKIESLSELISEDEEDKRVEIANGQHHTLFLDTKGKVYALGRAEYGRLGIGKDAKETTSPVHIASLNNEIINKIACGEVVSFAVSDKGELYSFGMGSCLQLGVGEEEDVHVPTKVQGKNLQSDSHRVVGVSAGGQHTVLLVQDRNKDAET